MHTNVKWDVNYKYTIRLKQLYSNWQKTSKHIEDQKNKC